MTSVLQEVLEVNKMPIEALRKKYKELFNAEAPLTASRRQLIPKITYQLQVLAFGGISSSAQRMIDDLNQGKTPVYAQRKNRITLPAGTLIVKEYRGETYKIKVTDEDFVLNGIHYSSLAKIARFITGGTNWNVQRFFKLLMQIIDFFAAHQTRIQVVRETVPCPKK